MRQKAIQCKSIPELELLEAVENYHRPARLSYGHGLTILGTRLGPPDETLADRYPPKVILAKMERLERRRLIECGVSLRTGWLTEKGRERLRELREGRLGEGR